MIVGIDIGGSTTDAVFLGEEVGVVSVEANDPLAAAAGALGKLVSVYGKRLSEIEAVAATGGGARRLGSELLGIPVRKVDEIRAIGRGGALCAGASEALVVSMGTGTALVSVRGRAIEHVGGTGVGGGTLLGLSRHLLQVSQLETIERLAARGDLSRVDLTVGDITGGPVGNLPAEATASNFGKIAADASPEDKARALVNMVAEVILSLSVLGARAFGHSRIVLTGKLLRVRPVVERLRSTQALLSWDFVIPPHAEFATAIGAAQSLAEEEDAPSGG
ncbi:MAG: type II pantothenate kinase [Candidatus Binatia bacterium]|nr:MAG: type II pantothenate kinase [Candidatus Binatia bacterium]